MKGLIQRIWSGFIHVIRDRRRQLFRISQVEDVPKHFKQNTLYSIGHPDPWRVAMVCPCGCKSAIHLSLLTNDRPRWSLSISARGLPTLRPSVRRTAGCRSHFFLIEGEIVWCEDR
jgi:hypothetical protein